MNQPLYAGSLSFSRTDVKKGNALIVFLQSRKCEGCKLSQCHTSNLYSSTDVKKGNAWIVFLQSRKCERCKLSLSHTNNQLFTTPHGSPNPRSTLSAKAEHHAHARTCTPTHAAARRGCQGQPP